MENSPFKQKIQKQHDVVLKQLSRFRNIFEGKTLESSKIQNYCNNISYVSDLYSVYVHNCMEYFTPVMKAQMLKINKNLLEDMARKLKYFSQNNKNSLQNQQKHKKQLCQVCDTRIRQVDVRIMKEQLADDAFARKSLLKQIYKDLQNENTELFTKDQDEMFFKFLNRILIKKQEVLSMQTKQISDFLVEVTKSFNDLNFLTQYTPVKLNSNGFNQDYKEELKKSLTDSLKHNFDSKIHPWVQKVFSQLRKFILSKRSDQKQVYSQTGQEGSYQYIKKRSQYAVSSEARKQVNSLKQEIQQYVSTIQNLKSQIKVLQKQKSQLQAYYSQQIQELLKGKRKAQFQLSRTIKDFNDFKQLKSDQNLTLKKKLSKVKSKPNQSFQNDNIYESQNVKLNGVDGQQGNNKNQNLEETQISTKRKKKSPFNKILSKKSDIFKQTLLGIQDPLQLTQTTQISQPNQNRNSLSYQNKKIQGENQMQKSSEQFLKQILLSKKSSKKHKKNFSKDSRDSKEQSYSKVQFQIYQKDEIDSDKSQIIAIQEEQNQDKAYVELRKQSKKKTKKTQQSSTKSKLKRMISIQTKLIPISKTSRQSGYKKKKKYQKTENNQQKTNQKGKLNNSTSNKKLFQYVPFQNQQQYEEMKDKISEFKQKIQTRTTQKLKASIKNIKLSSTSFDKQEIGQLFGYSIFAKKTSIHEEKGKNSNFLQKKDRKIGNPQQKVNFLQESQNSVILQEKTHEIIHSLTPQIISTQKIPQRKLINQEVQTSFKFITQNIGTRKEEIHTISKYGFSQEDQQKLYQNLKCQNSIPTNLTYGHYQILVRKLFKSEQENEINKYIQRQRESVTKESIFKKQHKESTKINIDAKILDQIKPFRTKALLNLPKLNQLPPHRISAIVGKSSLKTARQNKLEDTLICNSSRHEQYSPSNRVFPQKNCIDNKVIEQKNQHIIFYQRDLEMLFDNEIMAYQYEKQSKNNFNSHQIESRTNKNIIKLNQSTKQLLLSLFTILTEIKNKNHKIYHKICSFIRYPYQTVKNGFQFINIAKEITFDAWTKYLQKIFALKNCSEDRKSNPNKQNFPFSCSSSQDQNFLNFVKPLQQKLIELLVLANK